MSPAMVLLASLCPISARIFRGFTKLRQDEFANFAKKFSMFNFLPLIETESDMIFTDQKLV